MSSLALPDGYALSPGCPPPHAYLNLRKAAGLSVKSADQALAIAQGSWFSVMVTDTATKEIVGMGRIIGDGAWYFHIVDMAVLPSHQRKGIGDAILTKLLKE